MNEEQVKQYLFEQFEEWMTGQTVGVNPDGSTVYYDYDVERFGESLSRTIILD